MMNFTKPKVAQKKSKEDLLHKSTYLLSKIGKTNLWYWNRVY